MCRRYGRRLGRSGRLFFGGVLGKMMRDALVTVDTRLLRLADVIERMFLLCAFVLFFEVHVDQRVAVAALARIGRLHRVPQMSGKFQAMRFELLARVDGTQ